MAGMKAEDALNLAKAYTKKSLEGAGALKGEEGKSAYEVALDNGFDGSEEEWLESLKATGDNNVIESISVDGITVSPDVNKNVNLDLSDYAKKNEVKDLTHELKSTVVADIADDSKYYVEQYHDIHVIPDRHNTGCDETLLEDAITNVEVFGGLKFRADGGALDFNGNPGRTLTGEFTVENWDFTKLAELGDAGHTNVGAYEGTGVKIIYKNCKFKTFRQSYDQDKLYAEFYNCTFEHVVISNAAFHNCFFGDLTTAGDPVNPRDNTTFIDCYWSNMEFPADVQGQGHMDGMQVIDSKNVSFINCRWEVPAINFTASGGLVNNAVYIQTQNGGTENILVDHCVINGGDWYSIATDPDNTTIKIIAPKLGWCHRGSTPWYGGLEQYIEGGVTISPMYNDSLFVSSVWQDDGKIKFMVTNDTNKDRTLRVVTDITETEFVIPRTYDKTEYDADTKTYWDFPYDIEHTVNASNAKYVVFFEDGNQIRFVNFSGNRVEKPANERQGESGTSDYNDLNNKPSINGITLDGNKTTAELGIVADVDEEQIASAVDAYMAENPVTNSIVYISEADYLALVANGTYEPNTIYITEKSLLDGNEVTY